MNELNEALKRFEVTPRESCPTCQKIILDRKRFHFNSGCNKNHKPDPRNEALRVAWVAIQNAKHDKYCDINQNCIWDHQFNAWVPDTSQPCNCWKVGAQAAILKALEGGQDA